MPAFARISLDLQDAESFMILAVMVGTSGGPTFMNLMAPVVLNLKNRIGRQVPLETSRYTVAMEIPVPAAVAEAQEQARVQAEALSD
jgi:flagellar assembly factor FliW